jgi:hypothetical protein
MSPIIARLNKLENSTNNLLTKMSFTDIFQKIETQKPVQKKLEFWHLLAGNIFQCKITGRKLDRVSFERYQLQHGGAYNFIIELNGTD